MEDSNIKMEDKGSWMNKLQELRNLLEDNRELVEPRFDMRTYQEFNAYDPSSNKVRLMSYSMYLDEVPACGCVLGWGYHLSRGFDTGFAYNRNLINFQGWGHKVSEWFDNWFDGDSESISDTYNYLFCSLWSRDFNTLDYALERLDKVLGGYKPESFTVEVKRAYDLEDKDMPKGLLDFYI